MAWLEQCVCACPLVIRGNTVKHALTHTSSPPPMMSHPYPGAQEYYHSGPPLGGLLEEFPTDSCILDVGLRGSCWWATPQPGDLYLQVVNTRTLCTGTAQQGGQKWSLAFGVIVVTCFAVHMARVQFKAGLKCLSHSAKQNGITLAAQKCGLKFHMGLHNQVGRHGDTKHHSGAVPILLLASLVLMTSAYSNLGVWQGLNPWPQLLIASVYHSATGWCWGRAWSSGKYYPDIW